MNTASLLPWVGAFTGGSALIIGLLNIVKEWKTGEEGRQADAGATRAEEAAKRAEITAREHETWFTDFEKAYALLERRCEKCEGTCERVTAAFWGLLDDLDMQVMPMLMLPNVDHMETGNAVRAVMNSARKRVREAE